MKIDITETVVAKVAVRIAAVAAEIIREETRQIAEQQLFAELRSSDLESIERVAAYLQRTPIVQRTVEGTDTVVVTNEYLYRNLAIPAAKMKAIRARLVEDPHVQVHFSGGGVVSIYYKRREPVTAEAAAPNR